jgi:hypothetical protein
MSRSLEAVLAKLSLATCLDRPMLVKQVQVEEMLISMATLVELILEKATFSELVICRSPPKEPRPPIRSKNSTASDVKSFTNAS